MHEVWNIYVGCIWWNWKLAMMIYIGLLGLHVLLYSFYCVSHSCSDYIAKENDMWLYEKHIHEMNTWYIYIKERETCLGYDAWKVMVWYMRMENTWYEHEQTYVCI